MELEFRTQRLVLPLRSGSGCGGAENGLTMNVLPAVLGALFAGHAEFIELTAPGGLKLEINIGEIVAIRVPRHSEHFAPGGHCIVYTADGKYLVVAETCERIDELIREKRN